MRNHNLHFRLSKYLVQVIIGCTAILSFLVFFVANSTDHDMTFDLSAELLRASTNKEVRVLKQDFSNEATLVMFLKVYASGSSRQETSEVQSSLGPHKATVHIKDATSCRDPRFEIRLTGSALISLHLVEAASSSDSSQSIWTGYFDLPVGGDYSVDARWYGCHYEESTTSVLDLDHFLHFKAIEVHVDSTSLDQHLRSKLRANDMTIFARSAWISTNNASLDGQPLPAYLWKNPTANPVEGDFIQLDENTIVLKSGTTIDPNGKGEGFHDFKDLGNYELVCFWGSETMAQIREQFLSLRKTIAGGQRPFKFHYYNMSSFVRPDAEWTLETKERCRKCKHILVSVDEIIEPVTSQTEYSEQMTTFVGHLLKLMNDTTFPIWIFSVNEDPSKSSNCYRDRFLARSTDHPCNDVLRYLFERRDGSHVSFPDRVHFLDNTDLTLPRSDSKSSRDVLANIAMRVFVLVGKGVSDWRAIGQKGLIDGLHRNFNAIIEPNFKLVPYTGWD